MLDLTRFSQLRIFENAAMVVFTTNRFKPGGTCFVYVDKPTGEFLIIDCGLGFDAKMKRVSNGRELNDDEILILQLIQILYDNRPARSVVPLVFTHGHTDHICGVSQLDQRFRLQAYGTQTTEAMLGRLTERQQPVRPLKLEGFERIGEEAELELGVFRLRAIPTVHSIRETVSFVIDAPGFHCLHMAEFRVQESSLEPGKGKQMLGLVEQQVRCQPYDVVFYDALRKKEKGISPAEDVIVEPLKAILRHPEFKAYQAQTTPAVILPFISSKMNLLGLIQQVANQQPSCVLAPAGRAMLDMISYAHQRGWMGENVFAPSSSQPAKAILQPCTGSQAEEGAALPRALTGTSRSLTLLPSDWVFVVQGVIPEFLFPASEMLEQVAKRVAKLVIGKSEAKRLALRVPAGKLLFAHDLTGQFFELSSGHGRRGDQEILRNACLMEAGDPRFINYQSDEGEFVPAETESNDQNDLAEPAEAESFARGQEQNSRLDIEQLRRQLASELARL